jgi:hypothetical protein
MSYSIRYQQRPGGAESQHWTASLIEAKQHAIDAVRSGTAERAEIRDALGKVVFEYPDQGDARLEVEGTS